MEYETFLLEAYLKDRGATLEKEFRYVPGRKFRADYYIPQWGLLIEIQGGVYTRRAHGSISGVLKDLERGNLAAINGYKVMRFLPDDFIYNNCIPTLEIFYKNNIANG